LNRIEKKTTSKSNSTSQCVKTNFRGEGGIIIEREGRERKRERERGKRRREGKTDRCFVVVVLVVVAVVVVVVDDVG